MAGGRALTAMWTDNEAYEAYVGRWSRRVAERFLPWLEVPRGAAWIDVGCGTGVLTRSIVELEDPTSVVGVDPSSSFLAAARAAIRDSRVTFVRGEAATLPVPDASADAAVAGLALNFVDDVGPSLAEMRRATRPSGVVAGYVWDYAGEMQQIRRFWDAAVALDPAAGSVDQGRTCAICAPDALEAAFAAAGLVEVEVAGIEVSTPFRDFDDYWQPFLGGAGAAPRYLAGLDEDARARLRDRLEATLPRDSDGAIDLVARAWAARGRVPPAP